MHMNKYFVTWMLSCTCYAMGMIVLAELKTADVLSAGYICGEMFQIVALLATLYACNMIENIPHNFFIVKYSVLCTGVFFVYAYYVEINPGVYIFMLLLKLIVVIIVIYVIMVKWSLKVWGKIGTAGIFGCSGIYLSAYDFLIYGDTDGAHSLLFLGIGIGLLLVQNILYAVLYRAGLDKQVKLKNDYLTEFAETSADIIFHYTIKPYPRFSFVSSAAKTLLGYAPEDFYKNNKLHLEITREEDRAVIDRLLSDEKDECSECVITVETKNAERVDLRCIVSRQIVNEKVVAVEGVFRDVTEQIEAERRIRENNRNRQLMLSYISHDLKTPITYIQWYSEALETGIIKSEDEKMSAVKSIQSRAKSLAKLVDDISMLSKLESSKFNYEFEKITCLELVRIVRNTHVDEFYNNGNYSIMKRKCTFDIRQSINEDDFVLVDIKRIEQVFENIFGNAVKATDDGGTIKIECGIDRMRKFFFVSVSDDGVGMSKEEIEHIFENFYQSPQTKKRRGGSGLGLSISYLLIKGHGGQISVLSEQKKGSTFKFTLPLFNDDNDIDYE